MSHESVLAAHEGNGQAAGAPDSGSRGVSLRIVRQLLAALLTLVVVSFVTFIVFNLRSPRAIAIEILGTHVTPQQITAFIQLHRLNTPVLERYGVWLGHFVRGDMGISAATNVPVESLVLPRLLRTLILAACSLVIAVPLSLIAGIGVARRPGGVGDVLMLALTVVLGMPEFVVGIAVILLLGVWLKLLPVDSAAVAYGNPVQVIQGCVLPVLTLVIVITPYLIRISRAAIRDVTGQPFVRAAVLRGLPQRTIMWRQVLPNAAPPIINAVALNVVYLVGGVIVVENVFGFPGIGQLVVQSVATTDTFTTEACILIMGGIFIVTNALFDLLTVYFTPRLRRAR
jgi:peptide/nickel transport system permease protein